MTDKVGPVCCAGAQLILRKNITLGNYNYNGKLARLVNVVTCTFIKMKMKSNAQQMWKFQQNMLLNRQL